MEITLVQIKFLADRFGQHLTGSVVPTIVLRNARRPVESCFSAMSMIDSVETPAAVIWTASACWGRTCFSRFAAGSMKSVT